MPITPALRGLSLEDHEFQADLSYAVRPYLKQNNLKIVTIKTPTTEN